MTIAIAGDNEDDKPVDIEPLIKLQKDLKASALLLQPFQIRYLVDQYYNVQGDRTRCANQVRASEDEPNALLNWQLKNATTFENNIKKALDVWSDQWTVGLWLKQITGIGPVISAGLLAHLDIRKARTFGHFWSFAGLNPMKVWEKGQKRPYNAKLKTLVAFKAGECFVKFQNHKNDTYGKIFRKYRDDLDARNDQGFLKEQAALGAERVRPTTESYKSYIEGKLPDGHMHSWARRQTAKIFLAHVHHVMHVDYFGTPPPEPYVFAKDPGDHRHYIPPPYFPFTVSGKSLKTMLGDLPPITERT